MLCSKRLCPKLDSENHVAFARLSGAMVAVFVTAASWHASAVAQDVIPLPMFSACAPETPPVLPTRWRAVGLLAPFATEQLDVGEFVYDGTLPAMRATLYGLESGAVDLLITNTDTYLLSGPHRAPTGCMSLGRKFSPPSTQWLSGQAVCSGEAPIAATPVQWWKTPAPDSRTHWLWFKTDTRLPWRSMFMVPSPDPAVIGEYAMTYFPTFMPLAETNLSRLLNLCISRGKQSSPAAVPTAPTARALMAIRNEAAEAERQERIAALIPGLSHQACSRMTPVRWPEQYIMTAIISPIRFEVGPFPSIILYDWSGAAGQAAILYQPRDLPPVPRLFVMLKKGIGYDIRRPRSTGLYECPTDYPGMVRPDWMTAAQCQCRGVIDRNPVLSPNGVTQILSCPIKHQAPRVMWSWYMTDGRPVLFVEAAAVGNGLMLADYQRWLPGQKVPATEFEVPKQCFGPDNKVRAPPGGNRDGLSKEETASCVDCHTTRQ